MPTARSVRSVAEPTVAPEYKKTKNGLIIPTNTWDLLEYSVLTGQPALIVGPTGCGKTRLALEIGESLGRTVEVFHFGGLFDPEPAFFGTTMLRDGQTRFLKSRFADAAEAPNRVLVLDEINRTPGSIQNAVLSLCDFQRRASLDIGGDEHGRTIDLHESNAIVGTANIGASYVHCEPLDPALVGRTVIVRMNYPEQERDLLVGLGLDKRDVDEIMRVTAAIRVEHGKQTISASVTTRSLLVIGKLILTKRFDLDVAFEAAVGVLDDEELAALRTIIKASRRRK